MEKKTNVSLILLTVGISAGVIITLFLIFIIKAIPKSFTIAGVEFDISSADNSTVKDQTQDTTDIIPFDSPDSIIEDEENTPVITIASATQPLICKSGEFAPQDLNQLVQFNYSLSDNEFIFGQCTEFSGYNIVKQGGVAYIIQGPGVFTWSTKHGWWDICSGGTENDVIEKLEWQANSLETHSNTATGAARKVICSYQGETVTCEEK